MARHGVFSDSKKPTVGPYLLLSPVRTVVKPAFSRSRCVYDCGSAGERCRKRQHDHVKTFLTHAHCAQTCCNFWLSPWATCARYFLCVSRGRFARCGVCWHLLPSLTREWTLFVSDTHCKKKTCEVPKTFNSRLLMHISQVLPADEKRFYICFPRLRTRCGVFVWLSQLVSPCLQ